MIWIIGAGPMGMEYAKVIQALDRDFICITRSQYSANVFGSKYPQKVVSGGLANFLASNPSLPNHAIVASGMECLCDLTLNLIDAGVKSILVEKPGGMNIQDIKSLEAASEEANCELYVAYNRRFYASVIAAESMIENDGRVSSLNYEITEWGHVVKDLKQSPKIKSKCFIGNTSHVVDLAFHLGGRPTQISSFVKDKTDWHESGASFAGAGVTEKRALFAYYGNWNAPGRWSLEVLTNQCRYIFRPMEKLQIQTLGSIKIESVNIDYKLDELYKPGLYKQTESFLRGITKKLCRISDHSLNMNLYYQMANYELEQGDV
ncbi:MAG: hypothetical protein Alis3KO_21160 [Aliiglaciecola sp.]